MIQHFESLDPGSVVVELPKELTVGIVEVRMKDGNKTVTPGTETIIR